MKRTGFKSNYAAAVESAASSGGQIMPPVMGAGAFIMSSWTGIPYVTIIAAASIPALLYFLSIGAAVHFRAKREGLEGCGRSGPPRPVVSPQNRVPLPDSASRSSSTCLSKEIPR